MYMKYNAEMREAGRAAVTGKEFDCKYTTTCSFDNLMTHEAIRWWCRCIVA